MTLRPLTGPQANYGWDNQGGAQMAIDELNAQADDRRQGGREIQAEPKMTADPKQGPSRSY
jgi:branched-chain amino acid transport system substrate-binding protein